MNMSSESRIEKEELESLARRAYSVGGIPSESWFDKLLLLKDREQRGEREERKNATIGALAHALVTLSRSPSLDEDFFDMPAPKEMIKADEMDEASKLSDEQRRKALSRFSLEDKLRGVLRLWELMRASGWWAPLEGAFLTCDMRVTALLGCLWKACPDDEREAILKGMTVPCMSLVAVKFLCKAICSCRGEARARAVELLALMPKRAREEKESLNEPFCLMYAFPDSHPDYETPQLIDAFTPMPSWGFTCYTPQVVHTWTCPEQWARMRGELEEFLSAEERRYLEEAWGSLA